MEMQGLREIILENNTIPERTKQNNTVHVQHNTESPDSLMELGMMNTSFLKFGKLQEETLRIAMLLESLKKVQEPK